MKKNVSVLIVTKWKTYWLPTVLLVCLLTLGVGGAAAQEKNLTLDQAIAIALQNNQDLKQVSNQVQVSRISLTQKKTNFFPDLRLSSSLSRQYFKTLDTGSNDYEGENSGNLNFNASSTLNLFNGFYDTASLQQSQLQLEAAQGSFSRSRQAIVFETMQRYIQAVLAKEFVKVEKENLAAQELQLELIEDFYNAGRRPVTDLYQQKAEISRSQFQLLQAERDYEVNTLYLLQTLGLVPDSGYQVADLDIDRLVAKVDIPTANDILNSALAARPDLDAQQLQVQAAEKGVKAAQAGYWPKLSLIAEVGSNYNSLNKLGNFSDQLFDHNLNASVGLSLSVPLFDKGATKAGTASARIEVKNRELELEKLKNQVSVEVRQAVKDLETASRQVSVSESQLSYARSALESIEARYKVQASTMVELTQARASFLEASYERVRAKYNLLAQVVAVAYYSGNYEAMLSIIKM